MSGSEDGELPAPGSRPEAPQDDATKQEEWQAKLLARKQRFSSPPKAATSPKIKDPAAPQNKPNQSAPAKRRDRASPQEPKPPKVARIGPGPVDSPCSVVAEDPGRTPTAVEHMGSPPADKRSNDNTPTAGETEIWGPAAATAARSSPKAFVAPQPCSPCSPKVYVPSLMGARSVDCYDKLNAIAEGAYGKVFRAKEW